MTHDVTTKIYDSETDDYSYIVTCIATRVTWIWRLATRASHPLGQAVQRGMTGVKLLQQLDLVILRRTWPPFKIVVTLFNFQTINTSASIECPGVSVVWPILEKQYNLRFKITCDNLEQGFFGDVSWKALHHFQPHRRGRHLYHWDLGAHESTRAAIPLDFAPR